MRHPITRVAVIAGASALLVAACGSDGGPAAPNTGGETLPETTTTVPPGNEGGFGPQAAAPGEFELPWRQPMFATLEQDRRGCWSLKGSYEDVFVVLPPGFTDDPSGTAVVTADRVVVPAGTSVEVVAGLIDVEDVPGGADGRWGNQLAFCDPATLAVVVVESLTVDDFDPTALDAAALAELVARAEFDVDWGCGYGFATSTDDQRVGLLIDPVDFEPPEPGPVTLPDDRFAVSVVVGEHLFANHCDDVVEWFEPERVVAARYPVTAGSFQFDPPPVDEQSGSSNPVVVVLENATVETPAGPIDLGSVEIENRAYGFFAG